MTQNPKSKIDEEESKPQKENPLNKVQKPLFKTQKDVAEKDAKIGKKAFEIGYSLKIMFKQIPVLIKDSEKPTVDYWVGFATTIIYIIVFICQLFCQQIYQIGKCIKNCCFLKNEGYQQLDVEQQESI